MYRCRWIAMCPKRRYRYTRCVHRFSRSIELRQRPFDKTWTVSDVAPRQTAYVSDGRRSARPFTHINIHIRIKHYYCGSDDGVSPFSAVRGRLFARSALRSSFQPSTSGSYPIVMKMRFEHIPKLNFVFRYNYLSINIARFKGRHRIRVPRSVLDASARTERGVTVTKIKKIVALSKLSKPQHAAVDSRCVHVSRVIYLLRMHNYSIFDIRQINLRVKWTRSGWAEWNVTVS